MKHYIKSMQGVIQRAREYGRELDFELKVTVQFDAAQFNAIKKAKQCPLARAMPQIKNVVFDTIRVRGIPSYAQPSMHQRFPRAKNGTVTLSVYFEVSPYVLQSLGLGPSKALGFSTSYVFHSVDLNSTLEATRNDGHMLAKTAIASRIAN